jgi:hypothetical protein
LLDAAVCPPGSYQVAPVPERPLGFRRGGGTASPESAIRRRCSAMAAFGRRAGVERLDLQLVEQPRLLAGPIQGSIARLTAA